MWSRPAARGALATRVGPILVALALAGCSLVPPMDDPGRRPVAADERDMGAGGSSPAGISAPEASPAGRWSGRARGPSPVDLRELAGRTGGPETPDRRPGRAIGRPIPEQRVVELRREAFKLPANPRVTTPGDAAMLGPATPELVAGTAWPGPDVTECCGGGRAAPPDPELAVGPAHVIAVVNLAFNVYDKSGTAAFGSPITLADFFSGTTGCDGTKFDPNVLYDEEADRFFLGADGGFTSYCFAVSAGPDPTGLWHRYAFDTGSGLFDYPHAGVGRQAFYVGANIFSGGAFLEGRVYAIDRAAAYAGASSLRVVSRSTGPESTPQPAHLHGFAQGTWPRAGPHYLLTEVFDGAGHSVWSWHDPMGADSFTRTGTLDLNAATGLTAGFPLCVPQAGDGDPCNPPDNLSGEPPDDTCGGGPGGADACLESNDWRGLDAEYRNGSLWMVNSVACNPGAGAVNCVRWAQIDPAVPAVLDAGVFGSDGEHRVFPDAAANHCGDLAVGYTKSGSALSPAVWATGRRSGDSAGTLQPEIELQAGEVAYQSFDAPPYRWGDYTGMTSDPDGLTFWYLGEYSKDTADPGNRWGTYVSQLSFPGCPILSAPQEVDLGAVESGQSSPPQEILLANAGNDLLQLTGMTPSDPSAFSLDPAGGSDPCFSTMPAIPVGQSCTVAVTFHPPAQAVYAETLLVTADATPDREVDLAGVGYDLCPFSASETVTNAAPETGDQVVNACQTIQVGPYQLGAGGSLSLTAGASVSFGKDTVLSGTVVVRLDPFLALP